MKKYSVLLLLAMVLGLAHNARADEPFRKHRYDSWKVMALPDNAIVFAGNSITDMHVWAEAFGNDPRVVNRGNSGGYSYEVLDNVESWVRFKPAKVFIKIGTNDLGTNYNEQSIAKNIQKTVNIIRRESPSTQIYLQSILPAYDQLYKTLETIQATNVLIKQIADNTENTTYIDLYSKMGGIRSGQPYSLDNLHLMAYGYKVWTEAIKEYVGIEPVYPTNTQSIQNAATMGGSHGMRATYFSVLPVKSSDVLFFGDEMVKNGEWNELLHNQNVKNRGSWWGYGGNISLVSNFVDAAFANKSNGVTREAPAKMLLYTATEDINGSTDLATVESNYIALVNKLKGYAPGTPLALVSLMPTQNANSRISTFNAWLKQTAEADADLTYIDIYSDLAQASGAAKTDYFVGNYVYGKGYVQIARKLAAFIGDCTVIGDEEADALKNTFEARAALNKGISTVEDISVGEGVGQYTNAAVADINAKTDAAKNLLTSEASLPDLQAAATAINAAMANLKQSINPLTAENVAGKQFALSTPNRQGLYAYSDGQTLNSTKTNPGYAKYRWVFESRTDATFNIKNASNGTYINPAAAHNSAIQMSKTAPSAGWTVQYADAIGLYIIGSGTTCQLNSTDKTNNPIFNWYGTFPNRTDTGCQWQIEDVTDVPVVNEPEPITVVTGQAQEGAATIENGHIYTITNHQQSGVCYPLYVDDTKVLAVGQTNALAAKSYGRRAKFEAISKGDNKFAFKNVETGQYLIWKGNDSGFNGNKGVMDEYNATYCDLLVTSVTNVTNGKLLTGKRSNGTENGTFVQNADGTWNKWRDATVGFTATYSDIYTLGDVTEGNDGEIEDDPAAEGEYNISKTTGTMSGNGTWNSKWTSTDGKLTLTSNANNMQWNGNDIDARSGSAKSATYTLAVASGYEIVSYSFKAKALSSDQAWEQDGKTYNVTSAAATTISDDNVGAPSVVFTLKGENTGTLITEFSVTIKTKEAQTETGITFSTDSEQHWYYIYSTATVDYAKGKVWYYDANSDRMMFGDKAFMSDRVWSFWKNSQGKIAIKNFDGIYVGTAGSGTGGSTQFGKSDAANYIYQIENIADGQFTISDGGTPLHAQQTGSVLVRWMAEPGNASTWNFQEVNVDNAAAAMGATRVEQGKVTTGIGNKDVAILRSTITVSGLSGAVKLQGVSGKIVATDKTNVKAVRAYFATNAQELFVDAEKKMAWRESNGELYAEGTVNTDGTYTIAGEKDLAPGTHYLWIALDIADDAKEGNTVDATITNYTVDGATKAEANGNPAHAATIFLSEGSVLMPMDKGSLYYRIPAIATSADGKRLVVLTDDRKNHNADLPSHCYVVAQYSEDNGRTWSDPVTVAGTAETGGNYGHGDASLITNRINGDIIGIMTTSANGAGYFASTPEKPQTWKTIVSHDGGLTWETPVDHTKELYAKGSPNPNWLGGFTGSGAGLQKRDGTLVSPFVNRESPDGTNNNVSQNYYNFMSKDGGKTWYVSGVSGTKGADEPKVLERNNGDLAISVRASGYNYHNVTSDDGQTWQLPSQTRFTSGFNGNACDGDYMYWCSTLDGNPWDIVLQTMPNSGSRENVSIALSTDEGDTFAAPKTICPRGSAYSSATVLPDGTVGVYYEENGLFGGYTMRFVRFSLDWASNGKYKFTEEAPFHPIQTNVKVTMPTYGQDKDAEGELTGQAVRTLMLPFEAEIPEGMTVFECSNDTIQFDDNGTLRAGVILKEKEGTGLEAFCPYVVFAANDADFTFRRPLSEWHAMPMTEDCVYQAGALRGMLVNKKIMGDGSSVYGDVRYISSKGGLVFNRVTSGSQYAVPAYGAYYSQAFANAPDCIRIFTPENDPTGISSLPTVNSGSLEVYDLNGRKVLALPAHGLYIRNGKKMVK